jgi:tetratricopeptide (TPR) repeat protein
MRKIAFLCLFLGPLAGLLASPPHKEETARRVFDQLVRTRGELPAPEFQFVDRPSEVASFQGRTVYLGVKAYDVCTSFGADSLNALAILLAHELVHFYAGHAWEEEFTRDFAGAELPGEVKDRWLADEVQADLWGGLLAYSAGYDVRNVAPEFFPALYRSFQRGDSLAGYQSLSERVALARQTGDKVRHLIHLFETANYLVAIGLYEDALAYYQVILDEGYRGREMFNNIGVYHVQAALSFFRKSEMPYGLPVELDAESRIGYGTRGGVQSTREQREQHLAEALRHFKLAREMDPEYTTALVNEACARALLGVSVSRDDADEADFQYTLALGLAKKAEREGAEGSGIRADARVLRGLLAAFQGEEEEARSWWEKADSPLARTNLEILEKGAFALSGVFLPRSNEREMIEKQSLDLYMRQPRSDAERTIALERQTAKWVRCRETLGLEHSTIYLHAAGPNRYALMHLTDPGYQGQTLLGIKAGDSREKLLEAYKDPESTLRLTNGEFLFYPAREILFRLDGEGKVAGWCVVRMAAP